MRKIILYSLFLIVFSITDETTNNTNIESENFHNIENVDNNKKEKKKNEDEEQLNMLWEQNIHNFYPEDLLTIELKKEENFSFYLDVNLVPNKLMIAFYVHDEESKINFSIQYNKQKLYAIKNKNRLYHEINIMKSGTYSFNLINDKVK